ncbi:MAG: phenylalanine--tRNA ligase subunit beta [Chitinivibrionales bacterium]|nr:phenylalanine--tRNA ligase subunit beta [Chitinivibrionales bacterium]
MIVVYSWLTDFLDINATVNEVADALTSLGLEVAGIEKLEVPRGIVAARVLDVQKHPNADRLSLCTVDAGEDKPLSIVCGAPNVAAGMHAPLAGIGAVLGPEMTVCKAEIRGVESFGMLCSERELGLSDEHAGLMELPKDWKIGDELSRYMPVDYRIEIELTPDRGDCLSQLGVARDLAGYYKIPLKAYARSPQESGGDINAQIAVTIEAPGQCPRYLGRLVRNVKIGPSPEWLKQRLRAAGLRPISNVVDITNYILLHFGHPMHAFDMRKLAGKRIVVKTAQQGDTFTTLDEQKYELLGSDLLICDAEKPVALAGIMGGANSGIADDTTDVFLECAYFDPVGIRKTSKRLGLSTDSSYRFERGVDYGEGLTRAIDTAAEMMRELAGGEIVAGFIDQYPQPIEPPEISIRPSRTTTLLGVELDPQVIREQLQALNFSLLCEQHDRFTFRAPTYRHDMQLEVDLIEEVGRLYGYDNIEATHSAPVSLNQKVSTREILVDRIRTSLAAKGLHEITTNSLVSAKKSTGINPDLSAVGLMNPLNPEMAYMRTSLLGSLLETIAYNNNHRNLNNQLFEIGTVVIENPDRELPDEKQILGIIMDGDFWPDAWNTQRMPAGFFVLKGVLDSLINDLNLPALTYSPVTDRHHFLSIESALLSGSYGVHGSAGLVSPDTGKAFGIKTDAYYAELDITELLSTVLPTPAFAGLPKFPAIERDLAFVMDEKVPAQQIIDAIRSLSDLVERVEAFDVFRDDKLGIDKKSIAYAIQLRAPDRTLTDREAEKVSTSITQRLKADFGAVLRQ